MLRVKVFNHLVNIPQIKLLLQKEDVFLGGTEPLQNGGVNSIVEVDSGTDQDFVELSLHFSRPVMEGIFIKKLPDRVRQVRG